MFVSESGLRQGSHVLICGTSNQQRRSERRVGFARRLASLAASPLLVPQRMIACSQAKAKVTLYI